MNAHAVAVEKGQGRPIMSSFHAAFSLGGLAGAAVGGAVAAWGVGVAPHLAGVSALSLAAFALAYLRMLPADEDRGERGAGVRQADAGAGRARGDLLLRPARRGRDGRLERRLPEGHARDRTGIRRRRFAAFSAAMVAGRLLGDRVTARFGPVALVRAGAAISAAGARHIPRGRAPGCGPGRLRLRGARVLDHLPYSPQRGGADERLGCRAGHRGRRDRRLLRVPRRPPSIGFVAEVGLGGPCL